MGVLRARMLRKIRAADVHHRFHIYSPTVPDIGEARLNVHAKLMLADGRFLRIGSANLNNRSMGLDTECDLAIEGRGDGRIERCVAKLLARLLGEHLGVPLERVHAEMVRTGSPHATIEALRGGERTLLPLDGAVPPWLDTLVRRPPWSIPSAPSRRPSCRRWWRRSWPRSNGRGRSCWARR